MGSRGGVPALLYPSRQMMGRSGSENLALYPMIPMRQMSCQFCPDSVSLPVNGHYGNGTRKLSRMIKNLCYHMQIDSSDVPDVCSGELLPLCESCEEKMKLLWEYQGNLDNIGAQVGNMVAAIEKSVADSEILLGPNASSSISPRGVLPLRRRILEGYRNKLFLKKQARTSQPAVRNSTQNYGSSRPSQISVRNSDYNSQVAVRIPIQNSQVFVRNPTQIPGSSRSSQVSIGTQIWNPGSSRSSSASASSSSSSSPFIGAGYHRNLPPENFNGREYHIQETIPQTAVAPPGRPLKIKRSISMVPQPHLPEQKVLPKMKENKVVGADRNSPQVVEQTAVVPYQNGASVQNGMENHIMQNCNQVGLSLNNQAEMKYNGVIENRNEGRSVANGEQNGGEKRKIEELDDDDDDIIAIEPQQKKLEFKSVEIYTCPGPNGLKYYQCSLCSYKRLIPQEAIGPSRVFTLMKRHIRAEHANAKSFKCIVCHKTFFNQKSWKNHRTGHSLECNICGRVVKGKFQNLVLHRFTHKNDEERKAAVAAKEEGAREVFLSNKALFNGVDKEKAKKRVTRQRPQRKMPVKKIDLRLRRNRHLSKHKNALTKVKAKVTSNEKIHCLFCPRTFPRINYLKLHVKTHGKEFLPLKKDKPVSAPEKPVFVKGSQDEFCYALGLVRVQKGGEQCGGTGTSSGSESN